jgi:hypothetical protein
VDNVKQLAIRDGWRLDVISLSTASLVTGNTARPA